MDAPSNPNEAATLLSKPKRLTDIPGRVATRSSQWRIQLQKARPWSAQERKGWVHGCTQQSQ
jgi:hypothetical protein